MFTTKMTRGELTYFNNSSCISSGQGSTCIEAKSRISQPLSKALLAYQYHHYHYPLNNNPNIQSIQQSSPSIRSIYMSPAVVPSLPSTPASIAMHHMQETPLVVAPHATGQPSASTPLIQGEIKAVENTSTSLVHAQQNQQPLNSTVSKQASSSSSSISKKRKKKDDDDDDLDDLDINQLLDDYYKPVTSELEVTSPQQPLAPPPLQLHIAESTPVPSSTPLQQDTLDILHQPQQQATPMVDDILLLQEQPSTEHSALSVSFDHDRTFMRFDPTADDTTALATSADNDLLPFGDLDEILNQNNGIHNVSTPAISSSVYNYFSTPVYLNPDFKIVRQPLYSPPDSIVELVKQQQFYNLQSYFHTVETAIMHPKSFQTAKKRRKEVTPLPILPNSLTSISMEPLRNLDEKPMGGTSKKQKESFIEDAKLSLRFEQCMEIISTELGAASIVDQQNITHLLELLLVDAHWPVCPAVALEHFHTISPLLLDLIHIQCRSTSQSCRKIICMLSCVTECGSHLRCFHNNSFE